MANTATVGQNVELKVEGNILTITVDLSKDFGPSKSSGKTIVIASSKGNVPVPGSDAKIGLNVYKYPEAKA